MKRETKLLMLLVAGLALVTGLGACGGSGSKGPLDPVPDPVLCPMTLVAEPVAGFPGIYTVTVTPPGPYDLSINNTTQGVERGQLVFAHSGDSIQGCRPCGCSRSVGVR